MKKNVTEFEFGKIIQGIPASKFDCTMTHIYINHLTDEDVNYLYNLAEKLPVEQLQSYIVHWDDNTENLLEFFEVR